MTTATVLRLPVKRRDTPPTDAHQQFTLARSAMVDAWRIWINTLPPAVDIDAEIVGTTGQLTGLRDMVIRS